jgi:superfamily II DNA or RNA helicase
VSNERVSTNQRINPRFQLETLQNYKTYAGFDFVSNKIANTPELSTTLRKFRDDDNKNNSIVENIGNTAIMIESYLPSGFTPRPSQDRFLKEWPSITSNMEIGHNYIIQKDTGTGKTALFSLIAESVSSDKKVAIVLPTIILGMQTILALRERFPNKKISYLFTDQKPITLPTDVEKSTDGEIVIFVKDSFIKLVSDDYPNQTIDSTEPIFSQFQPDLVILDESHLCNTPTFNKAFDKIRDRVVTLSFSATPYKTYINRRNKNDVPVWAGRSMHWTRLDNLNPDGSWKDVVFRDDKTELLKNNESCPVRAIAAVSNLDFEFQVKMNSDGEYDPASIAEFENKNWEEICDDFIDTYLKYPQLQARNKIIVACPSNIEKTKEAAQQFSQRTGETTATVTSGNYYLYKIDSNGGLIKTKTTKDEVLSQFRNGQIKFLFSIAQLKEGFDESSVDAVMMMNLTKSVTDYIQILGRAVRQDPSKVDAIVVDLLPGKYSKVNPLVASVALGQVVPLVEMESNFERDTTLEEIDVMEEITEEKEERSILKKSYFETIKGLYVPINEAINIIRNKVDEISGVRNINLSDAEIRQYIDTQIRSQIASGTEILQLIANEDLNVVIENVDYLDNSYINQLDVYVNIPGLITGIEIVYYKEFLVNKINPKDINYQKKWASELYALIEKGERPEKSCKVLYNKYLDYFFDQKSYPALKQTEIGMLLQTSYDKLVEFEMALEKKEFEEIYNKINENGRAALVPFTKLHSKLNSYLRGDHKWLKDTELGLKIEGIVKNEKNLILKNLQTIRDSLFKGIIPTENTLCRSLKDFTTGRLYKNIQSEPLGIEILDLYEAMGKETFRLKVGEPKKLKSQEDQIAEWTEIRDILKRDRKVRGNFTGQLLDKLVKFRKGKAYKAMQTDPLGIEILDLYEAMGKETFRTKAKEETK